MTTDSNGSNAPARYDAAFANRIEPKWQKTWDERGTFRQPNPGEAGFDAAKPKFYCLDMFPYPSGAGLHVGHPEGYTATDIVCRYRRMRGANVLHPMGWDAFGLPAEQYAIQTGVHPAETTRKSIDNFRRQLQRFGFSYDWSREFATIDEDYYKWTQWIFLKIYNSWFDAEQQKARPIGELVAMLERGAYGVNAWGELVSREGTRGAQAFTGKPSDVRLWHELTPGERREVLDNHRLAYLDEQTVNWCPKLGTALANEEVKDGRSERGSHPVYRKPLRQWMLRITAYCERLLRGLEGLDWPESTRAMQQEWIGKSVGAEIDFAVEGREEALRVFTTRPDTIFGATYMVVAPEHWLIDQLLDEPAKATDAAALRAYVEQARNRSDVERQEAKEKTGVFTGLHAINPATGGRIPIWTADYVLTGYGTGAIMAVPAHDERDFEFAQKFGLEIRDVVYPRALQLVSFYAHHMTEEEKADDEKWKKTLADFMGLCTTVDSDPELFGPVLGAVRERRREQQQANLTSEQAAEKGHIGSRGSISGEYIVSIEALGAKSGQELEDLFAGGGYWRKRGEAFTLAGVCVHSKNAEVSLDGLGKAQAIERITGWLEKKGIGQEQVNYRLRDWLFSRQRYWGEPVPIVFDESGDHYPVSEEALPVGLPPMTDYQPAESDDPQPLLAKASSWVQTTAGAAGVDEDVLRPETPVRRETNTMPGWAGSCWYHLRYADSGNAERFVGEEAERYWLKDGVDLYIGGAEHAVLHLLYARFWHKVLFDLGLVSSDEPYRKLFHQGMILSHAYQRKNKVLVPIDEVEARADGSFVERATGEAVTQIAAKMSKSLKNVVNPDEVIAEYGADTFRLYEMYMGPLEATKPWDTRAIAGMYRFLQRAWRLAIDESTGGVRAADTDDADLEKLLQRTIAKVGDDIEKLSFNTAIAAMIEFVNAALPGDGQSPRLSVSQLERFVRTLAPFAPHLGEELWSRLGMEGLVSSADWPSYDPSMLIDDAVEVPVQMKGKVRAKLLVPADLDAEGLKAAALADPKVIEFLAGAKPERVIAIPGKMVNIVL